MLVSSTKFHRDRHQVESERPENVRRMPACADPGLQPGAALPPGIGQRYEAGRRAGSRLAGILATVMSLALALSSPCGAKATGKVFISNEKSSTLSILDLAGKVLQTVETCARPRGMTFNPGHTAIYVGCGDDNTIALYDIGTLRLRHRYRKLPHPRRSICILTVEHLYISNEDRFRNERARRRSGRDYLASMFNNYDIRQDFIFLLNCFNWTSQQFK